MTVAVAPRPGLCVRCGAAERRIADDGLPTFVCAGCEYDARNEVKSLEALYPGNRSAQRLAAMRDFGWRGGWAAR